MSCKLCGLRLPASAFDEGGYKFCCPGCREVFQRFGEEILANKVTYHSEAAKDQMQGAESYLRIDGMHCASCEILIEHLADRVDGIISVSASYATSTAKVVYDSETITETELPEVLSYAGYRLSLRSEASPQTGSPIALFRVIVASSLASVVMMLYLAFYYPTHLGLVDYSDLEPVAWLAFKAVPTAIFVLTTIMVVYVGLPIFRGAWVGLKVGVLNMDNLLTIAILSAWGYSTDQYFRGSTDLYFDVAAAILTVVTLGRYFERGARAGATEALEGLLDVWSPSVRVKRAGEIQEIGLETVRPRDILLVRLGEAVPIDGVINKGNTAIDESLMTGEPFPVRRGQGDRVKGGTTVVEGEVEIIAGDVVESQVNILTQILWQVQSSATGIRGLADVIARVFVPAVLVLAAAVSMWSYTSGAPFREAILIGLATLIVSCPCTFGLAMPLARAAGLSTALNRGIIMTSPDVFEKPRHFDIVAFDKTGTLSSGDMIVSDIIGPPDTAKLAAAAERLSAHPIAEAIARLDQSLTATDEDIQPGRGVIASVDGKRVAVGGALLFATINWDIPQSLKDKSKAVANHNCIASFVGWDGSVHGVIFTADQDRPEWRNVARKVRDESRVVLVTGAENAGEYEKDFDETHAGIPPEAKAQVIRHFKSKGTVAMIGDGSNDAPALAEADLGVAFGTPTALAAEAADVVIPGDNLGKIFDALAVIRTTRKRMHQNLGWALFYNATAIPLALSGHLNPLFAALAMSTSSLLVVWNSARKIPLTQLDDAPTNSSWTRNLERTRMKLARR